jgi:hypothetical protein
LVIGIKINQMKNSLFNRRLNERFKFSEPQFMNMSSEIIFREEAKDIKKLRGWILIYGRRKVGKTFLIKNFLKFDVYFRVRRDGKIIAEKFTPRELNNLRDFVSIVLSLLKENKTIVIDEFQRLPEHVLEEIASMHPKGKVILCGSSMRIIKKIFGERSPLLGLVLQYKLDLVKPKNILRELLKKVEAKKAIELAPYLSDVWTFQFFEDKRDSLKIIYEILNYSKLTIPSLIGEIFTEEERELTRIYEAILRLLGAGYWDYKEIASLLASRGLIERADSSLVIPYIKNLVKMDLVEPLPLFSSKKKMYKLTSAIMEAFYYLSDRYDFENLSISFKEVEPTLKKLRNLAIEKWVADFFAEMFQGRKEYLVTPKKEIDFLITLRKKVIAVGEVKWGRYSRVDIENFKKKVKNIKAKKFFVVKDKEIEDKEIEVIDAKELIKMIKGS